MTEDFLAVVDAKRFLGREFLTWLVHRIEEGEAHVEHAGQAFEVQLGDRLVLASDGHDTPDRPTLTVVGAGDVRAEIGAGLRGGKLIERARLIVLRGERRWELTLDGGMLTYDALRCPKLGERDAGAQDDPRAAFENDLFLRLADMEEAVAVVDQLFAGFCQARAARDWGSRTLPTLRAWVDGLR